MKLKHSLVLAGGLDHAGSAGRHLVYGDERGFLACDELKVGTFRYFKDIEKNNI